MDLSFAPSQKGIDKIKENKIRNIPTFHVKIHLSRQVNPGQLILVISLIGFSEYQT